MSDDRPTSAAALAAAVAAGELSAEAVAAEALGRADELDELGIFWALDRDRGCESARRIDERVAAGEDVGPLAGVPVAVKDSFDVVGLPTSHGTGGEFPPADQDAEPVSLTRAAGGVPLGKTAMDQLGWTTGGRTIERPPCLNPRDHARSPGGSSAGSAAAVAAGVTPIGIGTDAAGSVRIPAAYCGLVGLRPPIGAIPTGGMKIAAVGFDCVGVIADSMLDVRLAFEALSGGSGNGASILEQGVRIGLLADLFEATEAVVAEPCSAALDALEVPLSVTPTELAWQPKGLGRALAGALWRSWGEVIEATPERFSPLIRESAEFGRTLDDEELEAIHDRFAEDRAALEDRLESFDVLACPTVPGPVPLAEKESVEVSTRFTRLFSALDWPAISIPVGTDDAGMSVGLQLASRRENLDLLLSTAAAVEAAVAD